ncbi:MAG: hypothetical protein JO066_05245 [Verrucomicrobia bacterium]|nr:hypothetical protein [Verrucomicrobiota bacterium]
MAITLWQNGKAEQMSGQTLMGKLTVASSLIGLAFGFLLLGILILSNQTGEGISVLAGATGILLGTAFFMLAFSYWRQQTLKS